MRSLLWIFLIGTLGANSSACGLLGKSEVNAIVKIGAPAAVLDSQVDVDRVANLVPQDESVANSVSSVSLTVAGSCITNAVAVSIIVETANIDITVPCDASSGMFETTLNLLDAPDGKTSIRIKFLNSLVSTASMYEIERVVIKDTEGLESFSIPETFTESAGYIHLTEVSGAAIYRVTFTPRDSLNGTPTTIESTSTNIPVSALTIGTSYTVSVDALDDKQNVTSASNTGIFVNVSIGPPGAFSISSATNGNTQSVVTWGAASGATSYTMKYGTSSGSYGTTVSTGATSPTTITGLSNGTTYYIMVTAVNASGSTNASAQVTATPAAGPCGYQSCGNSGNGCYDDTTAKNVGFACLADGTQIDYVSATGSFFVWKEHNGSRILHASGLWSSSADWQKTLNRNGNGFTTTNFTTLTNIAGRACPANDTLPSVHISDDNDGSKFATGYCLYYDVGGAGDGMWPSGPTRVNAIPYEDYLGYPSALVRAAGSGGGVNPSWYEGNGKTCADKGMRLPAVFETNTTATTSTYFPTNDGTPSFAGTNGVPPAISSGCGQTATAYYSNVWLDWFNDSSLVGWLNNSGIGYIGNCSDDDSHRCVLP